MRLENQMHLHAYASYKTLYITRGIFSLLKI